MRIIDIILSITILISSAVNTIIGKDNKLMNYSEDKLNELEIYNFASLEKFILERNFESLLDKSNKVFSHNIEQDLIDNISNVLSLIHISEPTRPRLMDMVLILKMVT